MDMEKLKARLLSSHIDSTDMFLPVTVSIIPESPYVSEYSETGINEIRPELTVFEFVPVAAHWLNDVKNRINKSRLPLGLNEEDNLGQWLLPEIADTANYFFKNTSDVLPDEPFIYSSKNGSLVAEYKTVNGSMTNIISTKSLVIFIIAGDDVEEKRFKLSDDHQLSELREALYASMERLNRGKHGKEVGPK